MPKTVTVLSIDGGGIRGIIPAVILTEIEKRTQKPISHLFDLIAGTSTGGLLTLGLVKPDAAGKPQFSATQMLEMYEREGLLIFNLPWHRKLRNPGGFLGVKYHEKGIESVLKSYFGDAKLSDSLTRVLITSYELERRLAWFFKSSKAANEPETDFYMKDIARSTSAAPTYFRPNRIQGVEKNDYFTFVDGGVFANNPAMCAYVEAKTRFPDADNIIIVSLGTGNRTKPISYKKSKNWGLAGWAQPVLSVVFDGIDSTIDYQLKKLIPLHERDGRNYYRFQTQLDDNEDEMDNVLKDNIRTLRILGERLIRDNSQELDEVCKKILSDRT